jgi:hypothetical protein
MSTIMLRGDTTTTPDWAREYQIGTEVSASGAWGKVCDYEVLGRVLRRVVVEHYDNSHTKHEVAQLSLWKEVRIRSTTYSRLKCLCGLHSWDDVPRRGATHSTINFSLFSHAVQNGEQRCLRLGCKAQRDVVREGFLGSGSNPKWEKGKHPTMGLGALLAVVTLGIFRR